MNNITLFSFEGHQVRFVGTTDKPEWIAQDVCEVLGIKWRPDALDGLDDDERGYAIDVSPGGKQQMVTVTESGLYHLIFKSRKPAAKRFRKWVTSEVLPSIRRTGRYELPPEVQELLQKGHFDHCLKLMSKVNDELETKSADLQAELDDARDELAMVQLELTAAKQYMEDHNLSVEGFEEYFNSADY